MSVELRKMGEAARCCPCPQSRQIAILSKDSAVVDVKVVPEQHLRWLEELPLMHIDKHRVYVHAGVEPDQPLDAQDTQTLLW
jgi:serine/threonine protein phosphatase 1